MRFGGLVLAVAIVAGPVQAGRKPQASFFVRDRAGAIVTAQRLGAPAHTSDETLFAEAGTLIDVDTLADDVTPDAITVRTRAGRRNVYNLDGGAAGMTDAQQVTLGKWLIASLGRTVRVDGVRGGMAQLALATKIAIAGPSVAAK